MAFNPMRWWTRDTPLHSFLFCQVLSGLPFYVFNTYVVLQLQNVGYLIGTEEDGSPCTTYCIVPWGNSRLDLNTVLLYLNALGISLGGAVTIFLSAYSDFWDRKHLLVTFFLICYGAFAIPVYWLQDFTEQAFQSLLALWVLFAIATLVIIALLNIYIPHCMRSSVPDTTSPNTLEAKRRKYGFNMSVFGLIASGCAGIVTLVIVVILSATLSGTAAQTSGLLVTTITGFLTVAGSVVALLGLPSIPSKSASELRKGWSGPLLELIMPFKDLILRKNMAALLVSYTIYTDSTFAVSSVTSQLFYAEVRPATLEYTLYSLAQSLFQAVCAYGFFLLLPHIPFKLETWLIMGYVLILIIPVWGCIGLADVGFGFKYRWEFYVQLFLFNLSSSFVNASFRVLFSELIPKANEVRWFGLQLILSCSTTWINYVASGPLQNATHQLRFPLVISLVFLMVALVVEICRCTMPVFSADRRKWDILDQNPASEKTAPGDSNEMPKMQSIGGYEN